MNNTGALSHKPDATISPLQFRAGYATIRMGGYHYRREAMMMTGSQPDVVPGRNNHISEIFPLYLIVPLLLTMLLPGASSYNTSKYNYIILNLCDSL